MKKLLCILLILCFAGCSAQENFEKTDITISEIESGESSFIKSESGTSGSEENIFRSTKELAEYFLANPELCEYIPEKDGKIEIWVPDNVPEGFGLDMIRISGSYVFYYYGKEETEDPADMFVLEWAFRTGTGEKLLENTVKMYGLTEIAEKPGYYAGAVYSVETGEQSALKIYWAEDGFCFSASVPMRYAEDYGSLPDFAKKEMF